MARPESRLPPPDDCDAFDAERSTAVRLGVHMEEATKAVRHLLDEQEEEEEE